MMRSSMQCLVAATAALSGADTSCGWTRRMACCQAEGRHRSRREGINAAMSGRRVNGDRGGQGLFEKAYQRGMEIRVAARLLCVRAYGHDPARQFQVNRVAVRKRMGLEGHRFDIGVFVHSLLSRNAAHGQWSF